MSGLIAPRKESEFVKELRDWFVAADPKNSVFHQNFSVSGEPDLYMARRYSTGQLKEMRVEAKYTDVEPRSLRALWNLLRQNQQKVIVQMAHVSSIPIFLVTCVAGHEALWHQFDPEQCGKAKSGKIPPWETLVLRWESRRTKQGKWILVDPDTPRG